MSRLSKIVNNVPIQVQNRSGFDMSHEHFFTATPGTLIPAACIEVLPNDSIKLGHLTHVKLPPMATDFYGRLDARIEAFFVPNRLLYGGWQNFISSINGENDEAEVPVSSYIPMIDMYSFASEGDTDLESGTLADYLGYKYDGEILEARSCSALPFLAYHRIWNDWYRDSRIQTPCFADKSIDTDIDSLHNFRAANLPTYFISSDASAADNYISSIPVEDEEGSITYYRNDTLWDGKRIFDLRQRNYGKDLFTAGTLKPQYGNEASVHFSVDESGEGEFTIAALRAANSLQKFLERNNIAGTRYIDQIKAHFGIIPADATLQRPLYLGGTTLGVYNKSVAQTTPDAGIRSENPFSGLGAKAANPSALGDDMLVGDFHASEHGFIMVMFSLVPHAVYPNGLSPVFNHSTVGDFAFPILAGMGDEEIKQFQINQASPNPQGTFGYCQRYANYKYLLDRVSGLFRDSMSAFVLQRPIAPGPTLSTAFLEIPTDCLDGVAATDDTFCMVDMYFNLKMVRALPAYSLPTLGDEKDVHTVIMPNGGFRL